jgi:hypothetical protein
VFESGLQGIAEELVDLGKSGAIGFRSERQDSRHGLLTFSYCFVPAGFDVGKVQLAGVAADVAN